MQFDLLAQAAADTAPESFSVATVSWIITAVVGALVSAFLAHMKGKRDGAGGATEVKVKPQPLKVTEQRDPTWAEVQSLERRVTNLEQHMDEMRKEQVAMERRLTDAAERRTTRLLASQAESAGKIHRRVDDILAAVSRIEGKIESRES